jgi:hypothetical protein
MNRFRRTDETTIHPHDEESLSAYLDGELSPQEQAAVQQHLAECADCQWDLATLRQAVQWTRELPTVPLPRAFTIPVRVERERAPRRRWTLLPVLQGATALVALLLFVAVAGDFWFNGFQFARAPMPEAVLKTAQVEVLVTQVVEEATEAPAEMKAMAPAVAAPEAAITQEMSAAAQAAATAVPAPAELPMAATTATEAAAATMAPAGMGVGGEAGVSTAEAQADQTARAAGQPSSEMQSFTATVGAEPTPTIAAAASAAAASAAATVVAEAPALTQPLPAEQEQAVAGERVEPGLPLLRVVELGLAVALLLCVAATFLLALERRRAR